jgi:hypothetical protein
MATEREIKEQLGILEQTGERIAENFKSFAPIMDYRPSPEKWSARQVLHHLTDSEIVLAYRLRTLLSDDQPMMKAFDQNAWAEALASELEDLDLMASVFGSNRKLTVSLLKKIPSHLWDKKGFHEEAGEMTVFGLVVRNTKHSLSHLNQLEKLKEMAGVVV